MSFAVELIVKISMLWDRLCSLLHIKGDMKCKSIIGPMNKSGLKIDPAMLLFLLDFWPCLLKMDV